MSTLTNAMTVDVEDYFQVSAFESHVSRESWENTSTRVEGNMQTILAAFADKNVKATFFTLGWIAEKHPQIIRLIVAEGHELASHGWDHTRVSNQSLQEFRADIEKTKTFLEDLSGVEVKGYRAASYSISTKTEWAHGALADAGYQYSSSVAPLRHDLYGIPDAPRTPYRAAEGRITEIPVSTIRLFGRNVNCGGGGWFRLFPYSFSRWAIARVNRAEGRSAHFYFHPWEIDPRQPRISNIGLKTRFRHYINLERMYPRLESLLCDFTWDRMDRVFSKDIQPTISGIEAMSTGESDGHA